MRGSVGARESRVARTAPGRAREISQLGGGLTPPAPPRGGARVRHCSACALLLGRPPLIDRRGGGGSGGNEQNAQGLYSSPPRSTNGCGLHRPGNAHPCERRIIVTCGKEMGKKCTACGPARGPTDPCPSCTRRPPPSAVDRSVRPAPASLPCR